jgi:hypothetical protein
MSRALTVVDLDLAGGDIAGWLELPGTPNVSTLAADCRHGIDADGLAENVRPLPGRGAVQVVAGARSPEEAGAAVELLQRAGLRELVGLMASHGDVLIDLGRLDSTDALAPMLGHLDELLVVVRPTWSHVHHVAARLSVWKASARVRLVLVGDRPYGPADVVDALGVEVAGVLADDAAGAGVFNGARARVRGIERTRLWRSAAALTDGLARGSIGARDTALDRASAPS